MMVAEKTLQGIGMPKEPVVEFDWLVENRQFRQFRDLMQ
jgi:hypothetical protein